MLEVLRRLQPRLAWVRPYVDDRRLHHAAQTAVGVDDVKRLTNGWKRLAWNDARNAYDTSGVRQQFGRIGATVLDKPTVPCQIVDRICASARFECPYLFGTEPSHLGFRSIIPNMARILDPLQSIILQVAPALVAPRCGSNLFD